MSNRQRRKPPSQRRRRRETPESRAFRDSMAAPALDFAALAAISRHAGAVLVDGAEVPVLRFWPDGADPGDPTEFDRQVCAAGLRQFVRPRVAGDGLDALLPASIAHMLVVQLAPSIRVRTPIQLVREEILN